MQNLLFNEMATYFTCLALVTLCACAEPITYDTEVPNLDKVINGQAEFGEPGTVALGYGQNGAIGCTGTLIAPRTVLTAAHCIFTQRLGYNIPTIIGVFINGNVAETSQVIDYAIHRSWTGAETKRSFESGVDIATLYLDNAPRTQPIMVDRTPAQNRIGEVGKIVGFGKTDGMNERSGGTKNSVNLRINAVIGSHQSVLQLISPDGQQRGACHGDSGGPFFIGSGTQKVVSGVTSYGPNTCDGSSMYVSTAFFANWINENLNQRTTGVRQVNTNEVSEPQDNPSQNPGQTPGTSGSEGGSCYDLAYCVGSCNNQSCVQSCGQRASSQAIHAYNNIITCANKWNCDGNLECVNTACSNEVYACDPALLPTSQQPNQQQGQYTCGEMITCMSQCPDNNCAAQCYYSSSSEAKVEYEAIRVCAANMGCRDSQCVNTYCTQSVQACFY